MKILIVTYTYPPAKSVNGFRPYHFAKALTESGWEVSVLTRHFTGYEHKPEDYDQLNLTPFSIDRQPEALVYRSPFINSWFEYYHILWIRKTGLWKVIYLIQLLLGRGTQESYNSYFKKYLPVILKLNTYDIILVESGPTNLVHLISRYAKKFNIKYAIDFRDVYYHEMCQTAPLPLNKKIKIYLEKRHMRDCIAGAAQVTAESLAKLEAITGRSEPNAIIYNGFDESVWKMTSTLKKENFFIVLISGTLYAKEFLDYFLKGLQIFLSYQLSDVVIRFLAPGNQNIINRINLVLGEPFVEIIKERVSYEQAIEYIASSQVLAYHGWRGYKGIYSTKIFDYLRSGKKIWILPSDHDVVEQLVLKYSDGVVLDDPQIAADKLLIWYNLWRENKLFTNSSSQNLEQFSRTNQSMKLVGLLEETVGMKN